MPHKGTLRRFAVSLTPLEARPGLHPGFARTRASRPTRPGAGANTPEQQHSESNVQGKGAFGDPAGLADFVNFVRGKGAELKARAVVSIVPKAQVAFPQVGGRARWAALAWLGCGAGGQLGLWLWSQDVRRMWAFGHSMHACLLSGSRWLNVAGCLHGHVAQLPSAGG